MPDPTTYASPRQYVGFAVETTQGTAVVPAVTVPVEKFDPFDQPTWIDDKSLRGSMVDLYGVVQGVKHTEADFSGPAYLDTFPYLLSNVFGDIVYSGTYTGTGTTTLSSDSAIGATSVDTVASPGTAPILVQIDTGTGSEVRTITSIAGAGPYTLSFTGGLTSAHLTGATVQPITYPYSSAFAVYNAGTGQPSSMTITDYQGPTASTGTRAYPGCCISELTIKGTTESTGVDYTAKVSGWPSASAAAFTSSPSTVTLQPSWETTIGLAGTVGAAQILTVNDFEVSIKRELELIYTAQNSQNPYFIQRGKLTASGKLNAVVSDETFLTYLNSNTQPQLQMIISNGLSGANLLSLQIDILQAAFRDSKISRGKAAVEYAANFDAVANTTNVGYSGGFGPVVVTVQNAVAPLSY